MDGNLQWQKDLGDMRMRASFGEGSSPALYGDTLVINWDHEDGSKVYVLDARTGEVKWQKDRDEASTWNTPLVTEFDGRTQIVMNGAKRVRSYDLATGDLLWECGGQTGNPIPSPMRSGDLAICISGFRGAAAYAIPLDATGDITDTDKIAWKHTEGTPYVSCAAIIGDRLYFTKDRAAIVIVPQRDDRRADHRPEAAAGDGRHVCVARGGRGSRLFHRPQRRDRGDRRHAG